VDKYAKTIIARLRDSYSRLPPHCDGRPVSALTFAPKLAPKLALTLALRLALRLFVSQVAAVPVALLLCRVLG